MARPVKKGLDYFSLDVDFYNDLKIRKIVRRRGGAALSVYIVLLCNIYEKGYYIPWDEDIPFLVSEATGFEEDKIKDMILYCIEIGLFSKEMYDQHQVLTSHSIQQRYSAICALTKRKIDWSSPYLLIENQSNEVNSKKNDVISEETLVFSEETEVNSEIIGGNNEETVINSEKSTQRKEKERKVKRSPTSSVDTRSREGDGSKWSQEDLMVLNSVDDEITLLRASPIWREQVLMRFDFLRATPQAFDEFLERWGQEVKIKGTHHQHLGDAKSHFCNWLTIQEQKLNKTGKSNGSSNNGYRSDQELYNETLGVMARMQAEADAGVTEPLYK